MRGQREINIGINQKLNIMKKQKLFPLSMFITCMIAIVCLLSSCGDDDEPRYSELYGTWRNDTEILHFDSDGTGYYRPVSENKTAKFTWVATTTILQITGNHNGELHFSNKTYTYEVEGPNLALITDNNTVDMYKKQ